MHKIPVLNIEDDLFELLEYHLSPGHKIIRAQSGAGGLRHVRKHRPHLVVLDLDLAGKKGRDILKGIACCDFITRVIVLCEAVACEKALSCVDRRAGDVISKPFLVTELLAKIRRSLPVSGAAAAGT